MKRGDVYWYTFAEPDKRRPVLILTRDTAISFLSALTVAPITSTIREIPSEVYLDEQNGLLGPCAINFDNIVTLPKAKLKDYLTSLSFEKMLDAEEALKFALGCIR